MHIAIDASRTTVRQRTGTENYAYQMIAHLIALPSDHHFTLYFRDTPPPHHFQSYDHVTWRVIPFRRMWTHLRFAFEIWRDKPDVFWVPAHTLPRFFTRRAVVTVHDLGYRHFPSAHPTGERRYLDWSTHHSARRATRIMADSRATQHDLAHFYNIPAQKIQVVYPAVNIQPDHGNTEQVRQKYGLAERYLFFLGTLQPRKNIARLVKAFAEWRLQSAHQDVVLALGGKKGWLYDETWTAGVENVRILGFVDDEDVPALYSAALGFVFPSLFEGFGFPILEAMACGTPVLCANTSSLPELAGDAAILVDPLDIADISAGIRRLVEDDVERTRLLTAAPDQLAKFSWQRAAQQALQVIESAAP